MANNSYLKMFGTTFIHDIRSFNLFQQLGIPKKEILKYKEREEKHFEFLIRLTEILKRNQVMNYIEDNIFFNFIITPFNFKKENKIYLLVQIQDITEKKKIENQYIENNQIFKSIVEDSRTGIIVINDNYHIVYANNRTTEILGEPPEEIINEDFRNFISKENRERLGGLYKQQQAGKKIPANYEFSLINKKGETRYVELNAKVIKNDNGIKTIVRFIDKTDQKKTEKELRESEIKFKKIFEVIPDLFFLVKKDTTIIDYKGDTERLFLLPSEFLNNKISKTFPEVIAKHTVRAIKKTIETKEQQIIEYQLLINNEIRFFEARILYFTKKQVVIFIRDISDRKKTESLIKEEYNRLKEIDKIRKDLISRASHELITPIMAISSASEYLLEVFGDKLDKEPLELLYMINSNEKRLERLINDLLDISRIDYNKIKLDKEKCNISNLVIKITNELKYLIKERNLYLDLEIPEIIEIDIDIIRIEQVIINLLSNAIKNTPPEGRILISIKKNIEFLEILFTDTGIGLTKEEINRLFTQFGKLERYGVDLEYLDIRGSGLGLYISKEIIKMHNGAIQVKSKGRDKGSSFTIKLPID
ncbi:MAG: PAS domain S-box protein [Candidatus Lokiarchaeota archaeon]|nr:PAS domain S-box protein [Candidatus Lokiarchaeota archaeon]